MFPSVFYREIDWHYILFKADDLLVSTHSRWNENKDINIGVHIHGLHQ